MFTGLQNFILSEIDSPGNSSVESSTESPNHKRAKLHTI